jgi:hypothetical protein
MLERIFLDLDDVCNTFTMYVLNWLGYRVSQTDYSEYPSGERDMVAVANAMGHA